MTIKIGREDTAATTMNAIKKASESSQLRLQTLELAVAHLTNICIGLSEDVRSMKLVLLESNAIRGEGEEAAVIEIKLPYYSSSLSSDSKDDVAVKKKRQTWPKPLAVPQKKEAKASSAIKVQGGKTRAISVNANPKAPMRPAATTSQKGSTGSTKAVLIKNMAPVKTNRSTIKASTGRIITKNSAGAAGNTSAKASAPASTTKDSETRTRDGPKEQANKARARSLPVNVKQGVRASGSGGITVKLPPQMADAPTIRSLIYGSRTIAVGKSRA